MKAKSLVSLFQCLFIELPHTLTFRTTGHVAPIAQLVVLVRRKPKSYTVFGSWSFCIWPTPFRKPSLYRTCIVRSDVHAAHNVVRIAS